MALRQRASWTPVIVSNRDLRSEEDAAAGLEFSTLNLAYVDALLKEIPKNSQRRADLRFAIGVVIALALPAFLGLGVYVAAESLLLLAI
jgi:hypothetical protein